MKKSITKILSIVLVILTVFSTNIIGLTASAASISAYDILTTNKYAKVYTLASSGRTIPYTSKYLSNRGSVTYGKSSTAYIDNKTDELYLFDVGVTNGKYWAYVNYPVGSKRAYAYIPLSAITGNNGSHEKTVSTGKFYCSPRKGVSTSSSYYVAKGDTVYLLATSGSNYQILYNVSGNIWRIGWCSKNNYTTYCVKKVVSTQASNNVVKSNKISFNYSANKTGYTTSNAANLKINGTGISVGSTCYTYTSNGYYKTIKDTYGYTFVKVGSKYVNVNGWQCCAYARYIQYLLYGSHEFGNSKFVDVEGANGRATAASIKKWVNQAGVGAHIRSTRPHSLIVIGIDSNGFYYTDSNVSGANQIRVGYYTWQGFADSNYKNINYICYYKG